MSNIRHVIEHYAGESKGDKLRLICGVGVNDSDYIVKKYDSSTLDSKRIRKLVWICPFYERWKSMIERCYSDSVLRKYPSYLNVKVCEDWLYFSKFKARMEDQHWEGKHLDKDLKGQGLVYSPEACIFIPPELNTFITSEGRKKPSGLKTGVHRKGNKFRAVIRQSNKYKNLGSFKTEDEAHSAWYNAKVLIANELSLKYNVSDEIKELLLLKISKFYQG